MTTNEQAVASTLQDYERALNAADTNAVMPLYTDDGIFMAPYSASAIGREALRKAYDFVFSAIRLTVKFNVAEIIEISPNWVLRGRILRVPLWITPQERRAPKQTKSCLFFGKRKTASSG